MGQNHQTNVDEKIPAELLRDFRDHRAITLHEITHSGPALLIFLRHSGCPFCRETLDKVREGRASIEARGITIVLVHMGTVEEGAAFFRRFGLADLPQVSDPHRRLYRAFDLKMASATQLFSPGLWRKGLRLLFRGGQIPGRPRGNAFQLPGTFLLTGTRILAAHRHGTAADSAELDAVSACALP